jgi:flagellar basal body-associated protein FliL
MKDIGGDIMEKSKKSIVPVLFIIIVILLCILGFLLCYNVSNKKYVSNEDSNSNLNVEENNISNQESTVNENNQKETIAKIYEKIGNENFASQKGKDKLVTLNNGILEYTDFDKQIQQIDFNYGKPKYIQTLYGGGVAYALVVITEENDAYKINFNGEFSTGNADKSKFTTTKIDLGEKIIDLTDGYSGPYYLTESGKLLTEDGVSYDTINRNHIKRLGGLGLCVYINEDSTLETLRTSDANEYLDIVDNSGNKIKAKYAFYESSERWTGTTSMHFYVVDENDELLDFYEGSLMGKKVSSLKYDDSADKIEIFYTDNTSTVIEKVYQYIEVK